MVVTTLNPYQVYQQNSVMMASREELATMLYEGALKFLALARKGLEKKNFEAVNQNLIKAQDIIRYLNDSLDPQYEISKNLSALYDYILNRLVQANVKKDAAIIDEVGELIKDLRETWREAVVKARQNGAGTVG